MADTTSSNQGATTERSYVAEIVTAFSLLGITVLSTVVLVKNSGDKDMVRYVFASVIPLLVAGWAPFSLSTSLATTSRPHPICQRLDPSCHWCRQIEDDSGERQNASAQRYYVRAGDSRRRRQE